MARPLRLELAGGLYHVTARGDRREAIYFSEQDRTVWLDLLHEVSSMHNWRCHAWCQMTNHYHLVVETPEGNLARGMRRLNGRYAQYVNRSQRRVGHLFQGRYTAILVEKDNYLLELARYVVLNPVRAGMVSEEKRGLSPIIRATGLIVPGPASGPRGASLPNEGVLPKEPQNGVDPVCWGTCHLERTAICSAVGWGELVLERLNNRGQTTFFRYPFGLRSLTEEPCHVARD